MLSSSHLRCFALDLRKVLPKTIEFSENLKVLQHMTTNRTGKEGDAIFSTPSMIETMNSVVIKNIKKIIPQEEVRVAKVKCSHKAPLGMGKPFVIDGTSIAIQEDTASFDVVCQTADKKKVLGNATITVKVSENW